MRRIYLLLIIVTGLILTLSGCGDREELTQTPTPVPTQTFTPTPKPTPTPKKPIALSSEKLTISYTGAADWLITLKPEDHDDQIRDWMLLGLADILKLDIETLRNAFYDQMPIRDPIFYDIMANPVGPSRALPDKDGNLHILVPIDEKLYPDRAIGIALDDYRKNSGIDPSWVLLYRYTIDHDLKEVALYPESTASLQEIHEEYGFVEMELDSLSTLEAFLAQTTHLSYLELRGDELWAGGWKWSNLEKNLITAEDLTVLQDGYEEYSQALRFNFLTDKELEMWEIIKQLETFEADEIDESFSVYDYSQLISFLNNEELIEKIDKHERYIRTLSEPGFSLDPGPLLTIDKLLEILKVESLPSLIEHSDVADFAVSLIEADSNEEYYELLYSDIVSDVLLISQPIISYGEVLDQYTVLDLLTTTDSVTANISLSNTVASEQLDDLWKEFMDDLDTLRRYERSVKDRIDELIGESFFRLLDDTNQRRPPYQAARYDGGTQGTEVGMTLYYTDLVAKGWKQEKGKGGPTGKVPGFISDLAAKTPWGHCTTSDESGRLWFGLRKEAVSVTDDRVNLGSIATQVFTLIDNPDGSASEVEPSYRFGRLIWWWDRHYLAMADYEPQYHRLDQLMRWGAALAWLVEQDSALLPEVTDIQIQRDLRFDEWLKTHEKELKWSYDVPFMNPPGVETEALLKIYSLPREDCGMTWISSGGISGARFRELSEIASNHISAMPLSEVRRIGVAPGQVDDITGTIQRNFEAITDNAAIVQTTAEGRKVWPLGELKVWIPETVPRDAFQKISVESGQTSRKISIQDIEVGELSVSSNATSATIHWESGPLDQTRNLIAKVQEELVKQGTTSLTEAVSEAVESSIIYLDDLNTVYVRDNLGQWTRLQKTHEDAIDTDFAFRLAAPTELGDEMVIYRADTLSPPTLHLADGTPAQFMEYTVPEVANGPISLRGIQSPSSDLSEVSVEIGSTGEVGAIFTNGETIATKIDDAAFGISGQVDIAALNVRDVQWSQRVQEILSDATDTTSSQLKLKDGKFWISGDAYTGENISSISLELGEFIARTGVDDVGRIRGPPTYLENNLANEILEEGYLPVGAINSETKVRIIETESAVDLIDTTPKEVLKDESTEWYLPWAPTLPPVFDDNVVIFVIEEDRCIELIGVEQCQESEDSQ